MWVTDVVSLARFLASLLQGLLIAVTAITVYTHTCQGLCPVAVFSLMDSCVPSMKDSIHCAAFFRNGKVFFSTRRLLELFYN